MPSIKYPTIYGSYESIVPEYNSDSDTDDEVDQWQVSVDHTTPEEIAEDEMTNRPQSGYGQHYSRTLAAEQDKLFIERANRRAGTMVPLNANVRAIEMMVENGLVVETLPPTTRQAVTEMLAARGRVPNRLDHPVLVNYYADLAARHGNDDGYSGAVDGEASDALNNRPSTAESLFPGKLSKSLRPLNWNTTVSMENLARHHSKIQFQRLLYNHGVDPETIRACKQKIDLARLFFEWREKSNAQPEADNGEENGRGENPAAQGPSEDGVIDFDNLPEDHESEEDEGPEEPRGPPLGLKALEQYAPEEGATPHQVDQTTAKGKGEAPVATPSPSSTRFRGGSHKGKNKEAANALIELGKLVDRFPLSLPGNANGRPLSMQMGSDAQTISKKWNKDMQIQLLKDYDILPVNHKNMSALQLAQHLVSQRTRLQEDDEQLQPPWTESRFRAYVKEQTGVGDSQDEDDGQAQAANAVTQPRPSSAARKRAHTESSNDSIDDVVEEQDEDNVQEPPKKIRRREEQKHLTFENSMTARTLISKYKKAKILQCLKDYGVWQAYHDSMTMPRLCAAWVVLRDTWKKQQLINSDEEEAYSSDVEMDTADTGVAQDGPSTRTRKQPTKTVAYEEEFEDDKSDDEDFELPKPKKTSAFAFGSTRLDHNAFPRQARPKKAKQPSPVGKA